MGQSTSGRPWRTRMWGSRPTSTWSVRFWMSLAFYLQTSALYPHLAADAGVRATSGGSPPAEAQERTALGIDILPAELTIGRWRRYQHAAGVTALRRTPGLHPGPAPRRGGRRWPSSCWAPPRLAR